MSGTRSSVFIGSSVEGLPIAKAIQQNLDRACEASTWCQGIFGLAGGTLETLLEKVRKFDFAVLVLTADDITLSRETKKPAPRDNILLELGMFLGALGKERTFVVHDRSIDLKLPTDIVGGLTPATFEPHADGNWQAALGACCTSIETEIGKQGIRSRAELTGAVDVATQFSIISGLMDASDRQYFIFMFEQNATFLRASHPFATGEIYEYEIKDDSAGQGGYSFDELCYELAEADLLGVDLRNNVSLTPRGKDYAAWLIKNNKRADYFRCTKGGWGTPPPYSQYEAMKVRDDEMRRLHAERLLSTQAAVQQKLQAGALKP
jgi:hypothetical protein